MKKLVIIAVALLVLGGAGAGAWWFLWRDDGSAVSAAAAPPTFVELPPMTVSVIRGDRVVRLLVVRVTLEMRPGDDPTAVDSALPRLTDAFLVELHGLFGYRLMDERGFDLELVRTRLKLVAARVVGADLVTDVLVKPGGQRDNG
ncbi:MAG: hypothetical protein WEC41_03610 [Dongiaceae bacterium]